MTTEEIAALEAAACGGYYECQLCGTVFEALHGETFCPECDDLHRFDPTP